MRNTDDNECFKRCLGRYIHLVDKNPSRIRKNEKTFKRKCDFKDIKCSVRIRYIHKIEKENCISIIVFGYENRQKFQVYVSKNKFMRQVDLLLIEEKDQFQKLYNFYVHPNITS